MLGIAFGPSLGVPGISYGFPYSNINKNLKEVNYSKQEFLE
ncbi:MAG: hypothetical protein ACK52J_04435 [bacterium]